MNKIITFGSVCSGIEAAQLAFKQFKFRQLWSSEIAEFPCKVLDAHYPDVLNIGNMVDLPEHILNRTQPAPDIFCGGTPCQAFSLAGWKQGLEDERGRLVMKFIEIANAIDAVRKIENKHPAIILWENVEGVLNDRTNAFGNFIAGLSGCDDEIIVKKWTKSGFVRGKKRNVAWRVIDAKYYGLAQQRRRLYVLAGGLDFRPDQLLFEFNEKNILKSHIDNIQRSKKAKIKQPLSDFHDDRENPCGELRQNINGVDFEFFRSYTDCLYSAYGTKWNGNAAAYNGSLYVSQNKRIRRLTPLECERLMGIPDDYTLVNGNSDTNRYKAIGNSWAVPVVNWIGSQINNYLTSEFHQISEWTKFVVPVKCNSNAEVYLLDDTVYPIKKGQFLNTSAIHNAPKEQHLINIVQSEGVREKFYLTPKACAGILRRKLERGICMNSELERLMIKISNNT